MLGLRHKVRWVVRVKQRFAHAIGVRSKIGIAALHRVLAVVQHDDTSNGEHGGGPVSGNVLSKCPARGFSNSIGLPCASSTGVQ
jgi:hypothetical protein